MTDTKKQTTITERIYRELHEVNRHGLEAKAIYLGQVFREEFDELFLPTTQHRLYGEIEDATFAGVPLFWVTYPPDHFYIAGETR